MYQVIVNPASRSGKGMKIWKSIEPLFIEYEAEYQVYMTQKNNPCSEIVKSILDEAQKNRTTVHLVVLGGDGTLNEILQVITSFKDVKITVIPTGSSNDFARDIGLSADPYECLKHMLQQPTSLYVDLGTVICENSLVRSGDAKIPERRFIVSTGIGYDAAICEEVDRSKLKRALNKIGLGKLVYLGISLKQLLTAPRATAELTIDGKEDRVIRLDDVLFVAGMNHRYEGGGFMFGPEANNHDGKINLCAVSMISKGTVLKALPKAYKGNHFQYDGIDPYEANHYTIRTSEPMWVHTDGEVRTKADFVSVYIDREVIHIVY